MKILNWIKLLLILILLPSICYNRQIPVLMYHHTRSTVHKGYWNKYLSCETEVFASHLRQLQDKGYTTISFKDLEKGIEYIDKPVILTFDDGNADNMFAFKMMQRRGMKGVFFIYTGVIGKSKWLTEQQIKEMSMAGMEIGSHTVSHPYLTRIDGISAFLEIHESKQILEQLTGQQVVSFAYPFGHYNRQVVNLVKKVGYKYARTTNEWIWDTNDGNFFISIIYIHNGIKKLEGLR